MMNNEYILITPVFNEEDNIESLFYTINKQTKKPILWIISDNESTDNTKRQILDGREELEIDIEIVSTPRVGGINSLNFSTNQKHAYDFAVEIARKNNLDYSYIAKIDADTRLPIDFFEELIKCISSNENVGIVSARSYTCHEYRPGNKETPKPEECHFDKIEKNAMRDIRLYCREMLNEIGGFVVSKYSTDTIMMARSIMTGRKIRICQNTYFVLIRESRSSMKGDYGSYLAYGTGIHYLGYSMNEAIASTAYSIIARRDLKAIGILLGYLRSFVNGQERYPDKKVRDMIRSMKRSTIIFKKD
jgi:glycosyltransferase involved in cell wall biosynthesis